MAIKAKKKKKKKSVILLSQYEICTVMDTNWENVSELDFQKKICPMQLTMDN